MSRRARLEGLLQTSPGDVFLNFALAMELTKEGQVDQAVMQFDRVIDLDPAYIPAHFQKGSALLSANRRDDARAALTRGIETARCHGDPHAAEEMQGLLDSIA
jgi:predicted Zn-dependent protease